MELFMLTRAINRTMVELKLPQRFDSAPHNKLLIVQWLN
jgi:hypothetical protein